MIVLLAKSDSWSEEARLLKLGELRISVYPRQQGRGDLLFEQTLHLANATMSITTKDVRIQLWVHADTNKLRVSVRSHPVKTNVRASLRIWRNESRKFRRGEEGGAYGCNCRENLVRPDSMYEDLNAIVWYHRNGNESCYEQSLALEGIGGGVDPLRFLTSGGSVEGRTVDGSESRPMVKKSGTEMRLSLIPFSVPVSRFLSSFRSPPLPSPSLVSFPLSSLRCSSPLIVSSFLPLLVSFLLLLV